VQKELVAKKTKTVSRKSFTKTNVFLTQTYVDRGFSRCPRARAEQRPNTDVTPGQT
jgi:hypothetical protein